MANIHPTAVIDPQAQLDSSVTVGPYTVIGPHVKVGAGTRIGPHCVIEGHTTLGQDNRIYQFVSLGADSQDKKYAGEPCELIIGDRNTVREFSTYHIGTVQGGGVTRLGNDNWMMAYTHLAHDCVVGNHTIFANNAQLAGHVEVGDWVILGGYTVVHQFVRIGAHAMTAMCSLLFADVPPFVMAQGQPAAGRSMNFEGLRRRGFTPARIAAVKAMHKALYRDNLTLEQAQARIDTLTGPYPEAEADVALMQAFLRGVTPQRGIVR
ncbi:acyl-ACP--UDP-N-acetylglucosamine O-acyltransferase [Aquabacterium sp. A08]|uniref:acyl-ACP--UDP-N-acetylglucosamine O-acyltransferase n=1 Tax=Aquabacterium sp. A08 TaxID=2718532 RepID=UPI00142156B2|nr:acyl-ACP--UDP-N-acetylglucosamine O-acyltransferase [Aquabacterium sp. A08]NIC40368.1 acyl-ACP--UDP-N-acetylglucosamine O-acyltransferase [Aquabacterium sp. A08]